MSLIENKDNKGDPWIIHQNLHTAAGNTPLLSVNADQRLQSSPPVGVGKLTWRSDGNNAPLVAFTGAGGTADLEDTDLLAYGQNSAAVHFFANGGGEPVFNNMGGRVYSHQYWAIDTGVTRKPEDADHPSGVYGASISNHGTIESGVGKAIRGHIGGEFVLNAGRIVGDVELGAGDDRFINWDNSSMSSQAALFGNLDMGAGDDHVEAVTAIYGKVLLGKGTDSFRGDSTPSSSGYLSAGFTVEGGAGNDLIIGGVKADKLYGDDGDDDLQGGSGDSLYGGANNDLLSATGLATLDGGSGVDQLRGGTGNQTFIVDNALDKIFDGKKDDKDVVIAEANYTLQGGATIEILKAVTGTANINLTGNELAQEIHGNDGKNVLRGGGGRDTLIGGKGDDTYYVDSPDDVIIEEAGGGNDVIIIETGGSGPSTRPVNVEDIIQEGQTPGGGGGGNDTSGGGGGNDTIGGGGGGGKDNSGGGGGGGNNSGGSGGGVTIVVGNDKGGNVVGTSQNNKMVGGKGKDTLDGAAGDDTLWGMSGNDRLIGGAGKDAFVFSTKTNKKTNVDKIVDFNVADDAIWLDNKIFSKLGKKGSEAAPFELKKAFFKVGSKAKDKNDYVIYDKKKGVLYYDKDGSGDAEAVKIATLSKKLVLTHKDFFVI